MLLMLLGGLLGGVRLALSLGQPFPGVALMWRKELNLLSVDWTTPSDWPGLGPDKLQVNDRILCIDGYYPSPYRDDHGPDPHDASGCPQGEKEDYFSLFRTRFDGVRPAFLEFRVGRAGTLPITVPGVPVIEFTLVHLLEIFLPSFLLGLGLLAIGWVVYRANPAAEINLVFTLFVTIIAGLALDESYTGRFSAVWADARLAAMLMTVPWMPLLGAVFFHLMSLLTDQARLITLTRRVIRPYYGLSILFSLMGLVTYATSGEPLSRLLDWPFVTFIAVSCVLALVWGLISLVWTWRATSSRRIRHQTGLILAGLTLSVGLLISYIAFLFFNAAFPYLHYTPYLGLGMVGIMAYAILRYQLFASKARTLTVLLVVIGCVLVANLVYLAFGSITGFLPILAAALLTGLALEARRGPTSFFTRLLRRETLDYQVVAQFSRRVGGVHPIEVLQLEARQALQADLDVERLSVWLFDADHQRLDRFRDGVVVDSIDPPPDFSAYLRAHPNPINATTPDATAYSVLLRSDPANAVDLWVPLVESGQAVGVLGLGPRWTGEVYDEQDVQLIGILARQLALAILNARQWARLQAMPHLILQAEENERRKIARELHDTILQFLLVLTYNLDDLRERQTELAPEVERWQDRISAEAGQLRDLMSYLRAPELLVQQGLVTSLQAWIDRTRQDTAIAIQTDLSAEAERALSVDAQVTLYRVFREAIRNAVKHSTGHCIKAQLRLESDHVRFSIQDDGMGFDVAQALQAGSRGYSSLQDMRIYVENVGGQLAVRSMPGEETVIEGQVPITIG